MIGNIRENAVTHETELKKLQQLKSYGQIKIFSKIRAIFFCILTQNFNELEGPLRMIGFVLIYFVINGQYQIIVRTPDFDKNVKVVSENI